MVCGSILVRDHLPLATIKSAHFGWSLSGGSPVDSFSSSSVASVGTCSGSWVSRIDLHTKARRWQVVQLRDELSEERNRWTV